MSDEPEDATNRLESDEGEHRAEGDAEGAEDVDAERIHDDPAGVDRDGRYDERHGAARESANPDDHRDEEPHD